MNNAVLDSLEKFKRTIGTNVSKEVYEELAKQVHDLIEYRDGLIKLGIFEGHADTRKNGVMYLRYKQVNGVRPSPKYIGKKEDKQKEARRMLERFDEVEQIKRDLYELDRRFKNAQRYYEYMMDALDHTKQLRFHI